MDTQNNNVFILLNEDISTDNRTLEKYCILRETGFYNDVAENPDTVSYIFPKTGFEHDFFPSVMLHIKSLLKTTFPDNPVSSYCYDLQPDPYPVSDQFAGQWAHENPDNILVIDKSIDEFVRGAIQTILPFLQKASKNMYYYDDEDPNPATAFEFSPKIEIALEAYFLKYNQTNHKLKTRTL